MGGAVSTICAYDMANAFEGYTTEIYPIHYSFAAPRSFNVKGAMEFSKLIPTSLRIVNTEDSIPTLPPATWDGYTYSQTIGMISFTKSLGSLGADHVTAYKNFMPVCSNNAACLTDEQ